MRRRSSPPKWCFRLAMTQVLVRDSDAVAQVGAVEHLRSGAIANKATPENATSGHRLGQRPSLFLGVK